MTPIQKQYALYGGIALAVGIAAWFIFKPTSTTTSGSYGSNDPTGNGGVLNPGTVVFNAKNIAEKLYNAMKDSGTDEDLIFNSLQGLSLTQFAQVIQAFGKRSYNSLYGNQINWNPLFGSLPLEPLQVWLKSELSAKSYETLRLRYSYYL
ncbi:hypothetical protein [Flavobacterium limnosediminis]|uniref:hypothetical protein n=1 Tax=Flavobacterium limnosediminis TaxID=1401027 RepID=UPI00040D085D|nr:hypothetical protein [Flavobacterium limnosediminis]